MEGIVTKSILLLFIHYCYADGGEGLVVQPQLSLETSLPKIFSENFLTLGKPNQDKDIPRIDLIIAFDFSDKVEAQTFIEAKNFVLRSLCYFSISPSTTRVSFIRTIDEPVIEFSFTSCTNRKCLRKSLDSITHNQSPSKFNLILTEIKKLFSNKEDRHTSDRKKIVLVVSDGKFVGKTKPLEVLWEEIGAEGFVLKWSSDDMEGSYLSNIASKPTTKHMFSVNRPTAMKDFAGTATKLVKYSECDQQGKIVYDECNRRCTCIEGKLTSCIRVRKEFLSMDKSERAHYIATFKTVTTEEPWKEKYNKLVSDHRKLSRDGIEQQSTFLPYHRWLLLQVENLLQEVDCTITIPYWDWSACANDPWNPNHVWSSKDHGLGRAVSSIDFCVLDGPFGTSSGWKTTNGECLKRRFESDPVLFNLAEIQLRMKSKIFTEFELDLRNEVRDTFRAALGGSPGLHPSKRGTINTDDAAQAPEFYLHHAFLDKLWNDWETDSTSTANHYFHCLQGDMMGTQSKRFELLKLSMQPGYISIQYDEIKDKTALKAKKWLKVLSEEELKEIPQEKGSRRTQNKLDGMNFSPEIENLIRKTNQKSENSPNSFQLHLKGDEKRLGFAVPKENIEGDGVEMINPSVSLPERIQPKEVEHSIESSTDGSVGEDTNSTQNFNGDDEGFTEIQTDKQPQLPKGRKKTQFPVEIGTDLTQ